MLEHSFHLPEHLFSKSLSFIQKSFTLQAVLAASHIHGGTNTAAALELARTRAFTTGNGCRDGKKIAIVITDGYSNDRRATIHEAERLTDSGVLILVIGVGNIDQVELESTASFSEDVYMVDNYRVLDTIKDEIANRTSKIGMNLYLIVFNLII